MHALLHYDYIIATARSAEDCEVEIHVANSS